MNKRDRMKEQIRQHGENLKALFNVDIDGDKLARKIHSLEIKAHNLAEDYCNGANNVDSENWESLSDAILDNVDKVLNFRKQHIPIFVNGDARGYALKIHDDYIRNNNVKIYKDWGGYGILAPEFDGN